MNDTMANRAEKTAQQIKVSRSKRGGLFYKILAIVLVTVFCSLAGAFLSTSFIYHQLSDEINARLDETFDAVFSNVGELFIQFEKNASENIRKVSGILSVEQVWNIFMAEHNRYLHDTQQLVNDLTGKMRSDFDNLLRIVPVQNKSDVAAFRNAVEEEWKQLDLSVSDTLVALAARTNRSILQESSDEVKKAIRQIGESNVVIVGSQEEAQRDIDSIKRNAVYSIHESLRRTWTIGIGMLLISAVVVIIPVVLLALVLTRSITKPIVFMRNMLQIMARGDLSVRMGIHSRDEIGELSQSFDTMAEDLARVTASRDELDREIQDRRAAEERLKETQAQLIHSEKMAGIGELAAGIAHEINTPIQFISDNVQFLADANRKLLKAVSGYRDVLGAGSGNDAAAAEKMQELNESCNVEFLQREIPAAVDESMQGLYRMRDIISALKDYAHVDRATVTTADINQVLEKIIMVSHALWENDAEITTDFAPELPLVECYLADMNQAIMNLISNAGSAIRDRQKATGDVRKGRISIQTRAEDDHVVISISDDGAGIAEDIRNKIFDPFFTTRKIGEGSGLGLSVAYRIVQNHHGMIGVKSEIGKGSTFIVTLPVRLID